MYINFKRPFLYLTSFRKTTMVEKMVCLICKPNRFWTFSIYRNDRDAIVVFLFLPSTDKESVAEQDIAQTKAVVNTQTKP